MNINDYIKLVIQSRAYTKKHWIFSAFALVRETDEQKERNIYPGRLLQEPYGYYTYNQDLEKVKLSFSPKNGEPLFTKDTVVTVDSSTLPMVSGTIQTKLGVLLINLICLHECFGAKIPYQDGKLSPGKLERKIAERLVTTGKESKPEDISVKDYLKFTEAVAFVESLAPIFVQSISKAGLLPPPGRFEFRQQLLKKYEGKLTDPVEMAKFENELAAFDDEYLKKNDPTYGKFMSGKAKAARSKMYLSQGGETNSFVDAMDVTPIIPSLEEGIPMDQKGFTAISNTIRYGSFSRGAETVNGGVIAKGVQRASDNWIIQQEFCGTPFTKDFHVTPHNQDELKGRYILIGKERIVVESTEQAGSYLGQRVKLYSPQYCKAKGLKSCRVCSGETLSLFPEGIQIPLMNVSSGILKDSLKKMHNTTLKTVKLQLSRVLS